MAGLGPDQPIDATGAGAAVVGDVGEAVRAQTKEWFTILLRGSASVFSSGVYPSSWKAPTIPVVTARVWVLSPANRWRV